MRGETTKIIVWPDDDDDDDWEHLDDYRPEDYSHKPDDTAVISISVCLESKEIDHLVQDFNRVGRGHSPRQ